MYIILYMNSIICKIRRYKKEKWSNKILKIWRQILKFMFLATTIDIICVDKIYENCKKNCIPPRKNHSIYLDSAKAIL